MSTATASTRRGSPPLTTTGSDSDTVAEAIEVSRVFGDGDAAVRALGHVSVAFARGRLTAIMGPSGSGKSTLMHCMAALDVVTGGRILIEGNDIGDLDDRRLTTLRRTSRSGSPLRQPRKDHVVRTRDGRALHRDAP
ncbi:MAG: ATP-binding cassette domain-containing protein [Terracoccus sp.]